MATHWHRQPHSVSTLSLPSATASPCYSSKPRCTRRHSSRARGLLEATGIRLSSSWAGRTAAHQPGHPGAGSPGEPAAHTPRTQQTALPVGVPEQPCCPAALWPSVATGGLRPGAATGLHSAHGLRQQRTGLRSGCSREAGPAGGTHVCQQPGTKEGKAETGARLHRCRGQPRVPTSRRRQGRPPLSNSSRWVCLSVTCSPNEPNRQPCSRHIIHKRTHKRDTLKI